MKRILTRLLCFSVTAYLLLSSCAANPPAENQAVTSTTATVTSSTEKITTTSSSITPETPTTTEATALTTTEKTTISPTITTKVTTKATTEATTKFTTKATTKATTKTTTKTTTTQGAATKTTATTTNAPTITTTTKPGDYTAYQTLLAAAKKSDALTGWKIFTQFEMDNTHSRIELYMPDRTSPKAKYYLNIGMLPAHFHSWQQLCLIYENSYCTGGLNSEDYFTFKTKKLPENIALVKSAAEEMTNLPAKEKMEGIKLQPKNLYMVYDYYAVPLTAEEFGKLYKNTLRLITLCFEHEQSISSVSVVDPSVYFSIDENGYLAETYFSLSLTIKGRCNGKKYTIEDHVYYNGHRLIAPGQAIDGLIHRTTEFKNIDNPGLLEVHSPLTF